MSARWRSPARRRAVWPPAARARARAATSRPRRTCSQRALALLPPDAPQRADVQLLLGATLLEQGQFEEADRQLAEAEAGARETGSRVIELSAQVTRTVIGVQRDPSVDFAAAVALDRGGHRRARAGSAPTWRLQGPRASSSCSTSSRADTEKAELAAEAARAGAPRRVRARRRRGHVLPRPQPPRGADARRRRAA